jgi:hypothetical protein
LIVATIGSSCSATAAPALRAFVAQLLAFLRKHDPFPDGSDWNAAAVSPGIVGSSVLQPIGQLYDSLL